MESLLALPWNGCSLCVEYARTRQGVHYFDLPGTTLSEFSGTKPIVERAVRVSTSASGAARSSVRALRLGAGLARQNGTNANMQHISRCRYALLNESFQCCADVQPSGLRRIDGARHYGRRIRKKNTARTGTLASLTKMRSYSLCQSTNVSAGSGLGAAPTSAVNAKGVNGLARACHAAMKTEFV